MKSAILVGFLVLLAVLVGCSDSEMLDGGTNENECLLTVLGPDGSGFLLPQTGSWCSALRARCSEARELKNLDCVWIDVPEGGECWCEGKGFSG